MAGKTERDAATGTELRHHEWDGIRELDTPLPRWWLWVFYASILVAVVLWILRPAWPGLPGTFDHTRGLLPSMRTMVELELDMIETERQAMSASLLAASLDEIESAPGLLEFALARGASLFGDNCATCHGAGGAGRPGYPNLNDDVWLWGGTLEDIRRTIAHGIRSADAGARLSQMPAFGRDGLLARAEIEDLVELVRALAGLEADAAAAARARNSYDAQCTSCHGPEGRGDRAQGAPDLTDREWLGGSDRPSIRTMISEARMGVMPAWGERFDEATIRALAVYVHALGGGE